MKQYNKVLYTIKLYKIHVHFLFYFVLFFTFVLEKEHVCNV